MLDFDARTLLNPVLQDTTKPRDAAYDQDLQAFFCVHYATRGQSLLLATSDVQLRVNRHRESPPFRRKAVSP